MLKFTGKGYTEAQLKIKENYEVLVDTTEDFSVEYKKDSVTIHHSKGWMTLSKEGFNCEGIVL